MKTECSHLKDTLITFMLRLNNIDINTNTTNNNNNTLFQKIFRSKVIICLPV